MDKIVFMKISYRTHPVLEKLANRSMGIYDCYNSDKEFVFNNKKAISEKWEDVSTAIGNNIFYLEKPFVDAYEKAGDKLFESNLWHEVRNSNVCFINATNKEASCIKIVNDFEKKVIRCDVMGFLDNIIVAVFDIDFDYSEGYKPVREVWGWISNNVKNVETTILNLLLITLFIKYAEVETKHLPPGQKIKGIECKYVNDTKLPITILNSTWFTTLVKSDAFKVRGHFRLQPKKKDGQWTKELIWISGFQKSGYTAPARKLK